MNSPVFDLVDECLERGSIQFHQTNIDYAIEYFDSIRNTERPTFRVAVVGDTDITNATMVSRILSVHFNALRYKSDIEVMTGERRGTESFVRKYCTLNRIPLFVESHQGADDFNIGGDVSICERNEKLLRSAHALIIFSNGRNNLYDDMYKDAIDRGLLVAKRIIRISRS